MALRRRPETGLLSGLWEYPCELAGGANWPERWGPAPRALARAGTGKHIFTHVEWHMTAWTGELDGPDLPEGWVWASRAELRDTYAVPNAFQAFTPLVARRLGEF